LFFFDDFGQRGHVVVDSIYTPSGLADHLVSLFTGTGPRRIADFAAGDGALLKSAVARWPDAEIVAMDVDECAIRTLSVAIPYAHLLNNDFLLYSDDIEVSGGPGKHGDFFDLILLNPPFSCRGSGQFSVRIGDRTIRTSRAMAFIARAVRHLREDGELIAILPNSCLTSERDAELRTTLDEEWNIEPIGESRESAFPNRSVTVSIVRAKRRKQARDNFPSIEYSDIPRNSLGPVQIMRGTLAVGKAVSLPAGSPFIHSTNLVAGSLAGPMILINHNGRSLSGKSLLLPRVGRPSIDKIVLKTDPGRVVLSDCVVAIKTPDKRDESALQALLKENWPALRKIYSGSCASFLTMDGLTRLLQQFGYTVERLADMGHYSNTRITSPVQSTFSPRALTSTHHISYSEEINRTARGRSA
jgi:hypothetical protein